MARRTITISDASSIANNSVLIYGGKSGFTSDIGTVSAICSNYSYTTPEILLTVSNLHLIYDEILGPEHLSQVSNVFVKVPLNQYSSSPFQFGATGYTNKIAYDTLEVKTSNKRDNTITVFNKTTNGVSIVSSLLTPPMRISLFQPNVLSQNTVYVYGHTGQLKNSFNVQGISGTYVFPLKARPRTKSELTVVVDNAPQTNFTWPNAGNTAQVAINLNSSSVELKYYLDTVRVPAIEANDKIALISDSLSYTVQNTTFVPGDGSYNAQLTNAGFYKVRLSNTIFNSFLSQPAVNISTDLEGNVSNLVGNTFFINYDNTYPHTYNLANSGIYYLYNKNSVIFTQAKPDEYGRVSGLGTGTYIVSATNINRYNRASATTSGLIEIEALKIPKVVDVQVEENIVIDTVGGATINAIVSFPPIQNADVDSYEIVYRTIPIEGSPTEYSTIYIKQPNSSGRVSTAINNLVRGKISGSNVLELTITPLIGTARGYFTNYLHTLLGKTTKPSGIINLNAAQQGNSLLFTWQFVLTSDGFLKDLDIKEIEIREYPGSIDITNNESLSAIWSIGLTVGRVSVPSTNYSLPVTKFGTFTYILRVRDTSSQESDEIVATIINVQRPGPTKVYKNYNESRPGTSYIVEDNVALVTSNVHPELPFTSFSQTITNGLVRSNSSNTDNSNGSSIGFSVAANSSFISTGTSPTAVYITPIRDVGKVIKGTIRINPTISVSAPGYTLNNQYLEVLSGITDFHPSAGIGVNNYVLVDNAFGGIGSILGFSNANAATVSYNAFHRTLTSGGPFGNIYAIVNPGQFANDTANVNSYALITSVINSNAIVLGNVYFANGVDSMSNSSANLVRAGNSYKLVNMLQYGDPELSTTFLGPQSSVVQNVFIRYATDNVFYTAAANGVVGFPGHGNANPNAFVGATSNANLGFRNYVSGQLDFRYFQIKLEFLNKLPDITNIDLQSFTYEVDSEEKTFRKVIPVNNVNGVVVDFSSMNFIEAPSVTVNMINADISYTTSTYLVTNNSCNVKVFNSQTGAAVATQTVSIVAVGI
jgi:hypothetical protein